MLIKMHICKINLNNGDFNLFVSENKPKKNIDIIINFSKILKVSIKKINKVKKRMPPDNGTLFLFKKDFVKKC